MAYKNKNDLRSYWERNKGRIKATAKQTRIRRRMKVINHYGGECQCCSEKKYEFLSIDHVNGGGRKHRASVGANVDRWIIKNNYPTGFRILCHNCNFAIGMYGKCPHQAIA